MKLDRSLFGFSVSYLPRSRNISIFGSPFHFDKTKTACNVPTAIWDAKNGKPGWRCGQICQICRYANCLCKNTIKKTIGWSSRTTVLPLKNNAAIGGWTDLASLLKKILENQDHGPWNGFACKVPDPKADALPEAEINLLPGTLVTWSWPNAFVIVMRELPRLTSRSAKLCFPLSKDLSRKNWIWWQNASG